ncbi:hypothetical protein BOX15_Mlig002226g1, partial [Macrostomum lignano]
RRSHPLSMPLMPLLRRLPAAALQLRFLQLPQAAPAVAASARHQRQSLSTSATTGPSAQPTSPAGLQATVDVDSRVLTLHGAAADDQAGVATLNFPLAWLRDNCRCSLCHNSNSDSRQLLMNDFDPTAALTEATVEAGQLQLLWADGHRGCYPLDWLRARHFTEDGQVPPDLRLSKSIPRLWRDWPFRPDFLDGQAVMSDDAALLELLQRLELDGLVLLDNFGTDEDSLSRLCHRVAYPRRTHYGVIFRVESKPGPSNLAYTTGRLGFHTDLPYFEHQPDIQLLHCIRQTRTVPGGENSFADGFSAAELLRDRRPEQFHLLATALTNFRDRNSDDLDKFHLLQRHPVLELGRGGQVRRIHLSNQQRDSVLRLPLGRVQAYYEALKEFNDLLYDPGHSLQLRLKDGQLAVFENGRVLHSRTAYQGERLFMGAYLSWDETLSRRRVLQGL